jgi:hypothetical protein
MRRFPGVVILEKILNIEEREMPLTLVVQVLEHNEGGLIHADRIPKAITSDNQEILLTI